MSKGYYKTLGIEKSATESEIKKAFHKLAHKYHPDKKDGDEAKFKEVNEAYQVLSNKQKRAQYDQFGSAGGPGGGFGGGQGFGGFGGFDFSGFQQGGAQFDGFDLNDIFSAFTGGGFRRQPRGRNYHMRMKLTFRESIEGAKKTVHVDDPQTGSRREVNVTIPAGVESGQQLRVQGYGEQISDGQDGDLYIELVVERHGAFVKQGPHLVMSLPVALSEALLGGKESIELLDGSKTTIKIPAGLQPGQVLRVKGKGVPGRGDLLIETKIVIPAKLSRAQKKLIEQLQSEGL